MDSPVTVVATFQARPGKETELRQALLELVEPTRKEAGCLNYDLHSLADEPAKFLFHENWATKAHLDAHLQSSHLKALLSRLDGLCVRSPEVTIWKQIG